MYLHWCGLLLDRNRFDWFVRSCVLQFLFLNDFVTVIAKENFETIITQTVTEVCSYFSCVGLGFFKGGPRGVDSSRVVICNHNMSLVECKSLLCMNHNSLRWSSDHTITGHGIKTRTTYHAQKYARVSGEPVHRTQALKLGSVGEEDSTDLPSLSAGKFPPTPHDYDLDILSNHSTQLF